MKFGGFRPSFLLGALLGNRHSSASFSSKATSCGKVSKMSVCRRRKKWVGKNRKETCAKHKIDRSQNGRSNKSKDLFHGVISSPTSRKIILFIMIIVVVEERHRRPRLISQKRSERLEREESKVTVRHVEVLSAVQKPLVDEERVTIKDHCVVYSTSHLYR